mmetsp:Transcript_80494/g.184308  ORF Transcript_80494/g.184308 Transcript_80494/m.184308 type:complete len:308 (+) Transcript_80494:103-1026(+)
MFVPRAVALDIREFWRWLTCGAAPEGTPANKKVEWSWLEWTTSLQAPRQRASPHWLYLPSWRLLTVVLTTCVTASVMASDNYQTGITTTMDKIRYQIFPVFPLIFAAIALGVVAVGHSVAGRFQRDPTQPGILMVVCLCVVLLASAAELFFVVRWSLWSTDFGVNVGLLIVFHKYCMLRWMLDWADWLVPKYCECFAGSHGILPTAAAYWAVGWRWWRDALLGVLVSCVIGVIALLLSIPGVAHVHHLFLFRSTAKVTSKARGKTAEEAQQLPRFLRELAQDGGLTVFDKAAVLRLQTVVEQSLGGS